MNDDLIKRSDAAEVVYKALKTPPLKGVLTDTMSLAIALIQDIPSVDRPRGKWLKFGLGRGTRILFCTNCERRIEVPLSQGDSNYDFCPNCGAMMKGVEDEIYGR